MIGVASSASAALLLPGNIGPTAVTPTQLASLPAGDTPVPLGTQSNAFTGAPLGHFSGTLTSTVYSDPNTGAYDFVYVVTSDDTSTDGIERLTLSSFGSALTTTDADYYNVALTDVDPTTADRSTNGHVVGFSFSTIEIGPGQTTAQLIVETSAHNFSTGSGAVIDGAVGNAQVNVPAIGMLTVPEPTTLAALTLVGGLLLGRRRRQ